MCIIHRNVRDNAINTNSVTSTKGVYVICENTNQGQSNDMGDNEESCQKGVESVGEPQRVMGVGSEGNESGP